MTPDPPSARRLCRRPSASSPSSPPAAVPARAARPAGPAERVCRRPPPRRPPRPAPARRASPRPCPAGETRTVTIDTTWAIVIAIEADLSPIAAGNFVALAECGFYDGVVFHRVVPGLRHPGR